MNVFPLFFKREIQINPNVNQYSLQILSHCKMIYVKKLDLQQLEDIDRLYNINALLDPQKTL